MATKTAPLASNPATTKKSTYGDYLNPRWALLNLCNMNVEYLHNHLYIIDALNLNSTSIGRPCCRARYPKLLAKVRSDYAIACRRRIRDLFFQEWRRAGSSQQVLPTTGRAGILHARGSFNGLTSGALSPTKSSPRFWTETLALARHAVDI
jgi:hypothetical protein